MAVNGYLMAQKYPQCSCRGKICDEGSNKWDGLTTIWINKASLKQTPQEAMKYSLYFLLFLFMANCRDKNVAPETLKPLVAKWRLAAYERVENGKKVWKEVDPQSASFVSFRFDGVVLDSKDLPFCCPPNSLNINEKNFKIIPKIALPENPTCALIDCIGCPTWEIKLLGDEFIKEDCGISLKRKYVRVP